MTLPAYYFFDHVIQEIRMSKISTDEAQAEI